MPNDTQAVQPKRWTIKIKGKVRRRTRQLEEGAFISDSKAQTRFWQRILKTDSCWIYEGTKDQCGYGMFGMKSFRMFRSHRLSWILAHQCMIPIGMIICHHCDNPPCVNPDHLFLGTDADNKMDCSLKGRCGKTGAIGVNHGNAKINDEIVRLIRSDIRSNYKIASDYGITESAVRLVKSRKRWKHVL